MVTWPDEEHGIHFFHRDGKLWIAPMLIDGGYDDEETWMPVDELDIPFNDATLENAELSLADLMDQRGDN